MLMLIALTKVTEGISRGTLDPHRASFSNHLVVLKGNSDLKFGLTYSSLMLKIKQNKHL